MVAGACLLLSACGGGGSDSIPAQNAMGTLRIGISDAPIDSVSVVNIQFSGVTLKHAGGDEIRIDFDNPKDFDLLTLTNGTAGELLPDTSVPAGQYNWVRLAVNAQFDNVFDSYAMTPTGQVELRVPSGSENGLKLVSGFAVSQNETTDLIIDWDLRKALSDPKGQPGLNLRPALRVTNLVTFGTLHGTVSEALLNDPGCTNDLAAQTGNAVYVYEGMIDTPGDISDATNEPFVTATVSQDADGTYRYEVNYLEAGDYSAAFTCQASSDDADTDDDIVFSALQAFAIEDGVTTEVDF
jgi:hypothetical protein